MSKVNKSKSNRARKKKKKSGQRSGSDFSYKARNDRTGKKSVELTDKLTPEQLNTEPAEEQVIEKPEAEVKLYEPDTETSVSSDEQINDETEEPAVEEPVESSDAEPAAEAITTAPAVLSPSKGTEDKDEIQKELKEYKEKKPEHKEQQKPKTHVKKKRHTGLKVLGVLALLAVYCAAVLYGFFWVDDNIIDPDIYPRGTTINGVDVSGMNLKEARQALTDDWNTHSISIVNTDGKEIGELKDFDFQYDINDQLEHALSPGAETALSRIIQKDKKDIPVKMDPVGNTKNFKKQFADLTIVKEAKGDKPSKNAYIDKSDTEFRIVKEVIGNSVDTRLLRKAIFEAISEGDDTFEYRRSDYHKAPKIISTSKSLLDERDYCIKYLSFQITLRNPVDEYTIPPSWLDKMIKVSNKGKVKVSDEQVSQFISEVLYPKFTSVGDTRKLKSAGGGTYTISGGTYGYILDVEKEHQMLTSELKDREDVEREPYYAGKKPGKNWKNDIGNDFVEVSIAKQNCWVVRNGKTIVDTPVVTGVLPRHGTPTGVFYIVYKATNTTLKGRNDDGSKYESHVAYWMPFYLGFGLHDANWRGYFGGTIYIHNGSHGCVNCPPSIMPKIFANCYAGMPVIVH